jgi:acyl-CoA dehydrogenase
VAEDARAALALWRSSRPASYYDENLRVSLRRHLGERLPEVEERLRSFGVAVADVVDPAVDRLERRRDLPAVAGPDALGRETQAVEFDPAYAEAGRAVWGSGVLALPERPGAAFEQAALLYLLAHAGEGGHACPVVCTAGLIRALRRYGSDELRARFLPPLLDTDYDRCQRGAQFLTEIQGGSDVGANSVEAVPAGDDVWRISGEKWFCSVADADQFAVTARPRGGPAGTAGIGCFLVPRVLPSGDVNGFRLRRLKDKLGTRALATGEIEFDGALAYPIGAVEDGFRIAAGVVLNTSRWLNAAGSTGLMRRAYLEAASFSRIRTAFGRPLVDFPLVRENLAVMKTEEQAALASTLELTALVDRLDTGAADDGDRLWHRVLVNANKVVTSLAATRAVRRGIEALGGNGTIEDFSPLPRLWRDAIVFESWEGTHNVLCEQVLRDLRRLDALDVALERIRALLPDVDGAAAVDDALTQLEPRIRRSLASEATGALHFRRQLDVLVRALQGAALLAEAAAEPDRSAAAGKEGIAALHVRRHLIHNYDTEADPDYPDLLARVLGPDAAA